MRPIPPAPAPGQRILLIPAMLDAHFPLLQYAFHSKAYYPVILSQSRGLADLGLRYAHNDLCYPFVLSLGQYLQALGSGAYDLDQVSLLMPSAGDACRDRWTDQLAGELRSGAPLTLRRMKEVFSPGRRGLCRPAPPAGGQEAGGPGGGALHQILRPGQLGHPPLSGGGGL